MMSLAAIARDPRCIYAIDARGGGTVYSRVGGSGYPTPSVPDHISNAQCPTWECDVGLIRYASRSGDVITDYNVKHDAGYFGAADLTQLWRVATPLSLKGYADSITLSYCLYIPSDTASKYYRYAEHAGCFGLALSGTICVGGSYNLIVITNNGSQDVYYIHTRSADMSGTHVVSIVIDQDTGRILGYVDGAIIMTKTITNPGPLNPNTSKTELNIGSVSPSAAGLRVMSHIALRGVLSPAEIQSLSTIMRG